MLIPLLADSYKQCHHRMYKLGTSLVYSNLTPRSSRLNTDYIIWFGMQAFMNQLRKDFSEFSNTSWNNVKEEVGSILERHIGEKDLARFKQLHEYGKIPLEFRWLPEGSNVPIRVPVLTVHNTVPEFFWFTNFIETYMSCSLWQMSTSATIASIYRKILDDYCDLTGGDKSFVDFQAHDFSFRGMSSLQSAMYSGAGHLLFFKGTDTIPAIKFIEDNYGECEAYSVPATEHSVMCSYGDMNERDCFVSLMDEFPSGILSIVSDTWDFWNVITNTIPSLKDKIMGRSGKIVVRPDCYDDQTSILTNSGWKLFKDLNDKDLVAQVEEDGYSFVKPQKIIKSRYKGKMVKFSDNHGKCDLVVTPNHRMITYRKGKELIQEAEKVTFYHDKDMLRSFKSKSLGKSLSPLERLKIAFQADGSFVTRSRTNIRFSFSKQRKIDRIIWIINQCGYKYSMYDLKDGRYEIHIKCDSTLFEKGFSWVDTTNLCYNWSVEFLDELSHWDSSVRHSGRIKYDSTNESCVDVVELVCIAAGYGCVKSSRSDDRKEIFSDVHTLHILKDNRIGGQSINKEFVDYDGYVYCVKVPTGKIIVKRGRGTCVSGNSGDPVKIVCGDPDATEECVRKGAIECLWDTFGGKVNDKGFKELDPHIGLIYGDSITIDRCKQILENLKNKGFASTNIVFGVGSYTYQCNTRDTLGFAMKATAAIIDGKPVELYKNPKTDDGTKRSAKGFLSVEDGRDKFVLTDSVPYEDWKNKDLDSWKSKECLRHHDTFGVHAGGYDKVWKDLREYSIMNL